MTKLSYHCTFWPKSITFHVDNAAISPDARYEPVGIESELHIADYYKYANESKAATKDYLKSSSIFKDEESELAPYAN
jgi:hypothetical protein